MAKNEIVKGEISRCQSPTTGAIYVLREDGMIFRKGVLCERFKEWKRFKQEVIEEYGMPWVKERFEGALKTDDPNDRGFWGKSMLYGKAIVPQPTIKELEWWSFDGVAEALDGCRVEPDGTCEHGSRSWLLMAGVI